MQVPLILGFHNLLVAGAGAGVPIALPIDQISLIQSLFLWNGWWMVVFVFASTIAAIYLAKGWRKQQEFKLQEVRSRIATDLHDDIGSSLSQVAIMCEVLSRQSLTERETLQEIAGVSRNVLASMSEIVWAVDPSHDHLRDLTQRMRWFAGETLAGRGVALDFTALEPSWEVRLEAETRRQIFLIFKECVHNIVRHAGASHARILLRVADSQLALTVEDDGRGFDPKKVAEGNGLRNIRHRARLLDASIETRSTIGRGTVFVLRVPLAPWARDWRHLGVRAHKRAVGQ
jgi:signal transduction histidine kinase